MKTAKLNTRNQLRVGDSFRESTSVISAAFTIRFIGKERNIPSTITSDFKNSIGKKSFVNKMRRQSRNKILHIKATLARNNSHRIIFGEKYH